MPKHPMEFWYARELALVLDYTKWENFHKVIKWTMIACKNSGHDPLYDFPEVRKIVEAGATTKRIQDYLIEVWGLTLPEAVSAIDGTKSAPQRCLIQVYQATACAATLYDNAGL